MLKKPAISYNPFFLFPFFVWVAAGGIWQILFTRDELFFAVNRNYSATADIVMYYLTWLGQGEVIITTLALLMLFPRFRNRMYFFTAFLCNAIPFVLQQGLKSFFNAPRPQLCYKNHFWIHCAPDWPVLMERGFPSGHSEGAFSFLCFVSLVLPHRYRAWGFVFFLLALSVCYSRIYLAAHFFSDVYVGSIVGTVITTFVFYVIDNNKQRIFQKKDTFIP